MDRDFREPEPRRRLGQGTMKSSCGTGKGSAPRRLEGVGEAPPF